MKKFLINVRTSQLIVHVENVMFEEAIADRDAEEITQWVHQTQSGMRIAYDRWKLNDQQAITAFLLKWG